jgi:hypothetical protein
MAEEYDRKILPDLVQDTVAISLGMTFKSFEMIKDPIGSFGQVTEALQTLFTIPADAAGKGLQEKAQAVAGVWMEKAAGLMEACKTAGQKFTDGK